MSRYKFLFFAVAFSYFECTISPKNTPSAPSKHYILENELCNFPCIDPWMFKDFYVNKSYIPCSKGTPLVYLDKVDGKVYAVVNSTMRASINFNCCVRNIYRAKNAGIPDDNIEESRCVQFDNEGRLELNNDVVKITCYKLDGNNFEDLYENVYGVYTPHNIKHKSLKERSDSKSFSVLMLAIDSVSRQNFVRLMPETHEYLLDKGWINLQAYNQVGQDTLPNILALLTGYSEKLAFETFGNPLEKFYDEVQFVWYDFQRYGYVTAYAEDYPIMNTFNKNSKGFWQPPTDYYFRHLSIAAERLNTTYLDNMPHCTGPENSGERILNLALDFMVTFARYQYFGLFWINSFSHEDFNALGRKDHRITQFLEKLEPYMNDTIVIFLSDHGYHKNDITYTTLGWFESKMPFFYMFLPENFKNKYRDEAENLEENANKLVSPFDVYATLQDILSLSENHAIRDVKSCEKCASLFRYIPSVRSCAEAGIEDKWCNCIKNISTEVQVKRMITASSFRMEPFESLILYGVFLVLITRLLVV